MTGWSILCGILFSLYREEDFIMMYPRLKDINTLQLSIDYHQHQQSNTTSLSTSLFTSLSTRLSTSLRNKTTVKRTKCPPQTPATSPTAPTSKSKTSPGRAASHRTTLALRIWMNPNRRVSSPHSTRHDGDEYANTGTEGHCITRRPG